MKKRYLTVTLLVLTALLASPGAALAAPAAAPEPAPAADEVIFGSDYTVASGQTLNGSLVLLGGSLTVEEGGRITGEAVVFGGDVELAGSIGGSAILFGGEMNQTADASVAQEVVVFGGDVHVAGSVGSNLVVVGGDAQLASTAVVQGDLVTPTGDIQRAAGAVVNGNIIDHLRFNTPENALFPRGPLFPNGPVSPAGPRAPEATAAPMVPYMQEPDVVRGWQRGWSIGGDFVWLLFRSFALATVALLVVLFAQHQMRRVADAVVDQPALAGGYGLLAVIVAGVAVIGLSLTLILIPVAVLVPFVLVTAWAFGWISLGQEVGRRMAEGFKATWSPALEASLGTFALTFATGVVSFLPCIGWLLGAVAGMAGLGAVVMTRFGSQVHMGAGAPNPVAAPALPTPRKRKTTAAKTPAKKSTRRS